MFNNANLVFVGVGVLGVDGACAEAAVPHVEHHALLRPHGGVVVPRALHQEVQNRDLLLVRQQTEHDHRVPGLVGLWKQQAQGELPSGRLKTRNCLWIDRNSASLQISNLTKSGEQNKMCTARQETSC